MSGFGKSLFGFSGTGTAADVRRRGKVHEKKQKQQLLRKDKEEWDFYGLFPKRQIHVPRLPYPLWDGEWQELFPQQQGPDAQKQRKVVRHILLIRHGQYDEKWAAENESEEEKKRDELMEDHRFYHKPFNPLTDVGRQQAECVGRHLAEIMEDSNRSGKVGITYMVNSRLVRAQETADIIAKHLPDNVRRDKTDRLLNEGEPAQFLPRKKKVSSMADTENYIALVDMDHARIEQAFTNILVIPSGGRKRYKSTRQNDRRWRTMVWSKTRRWHWSALWLRQKSTILRR
jgi:phosphohistidine phosphatase SixA